MVETYADSESLSSPQVYLVRVLVFLAVIVCVLVVLSGHIFRNFLYNPVINGLIIACLLIGVILAISQIFRLFPEVRWVNNFMLREDDGVTSVRDPLLLAPMAALLDASQSSGALSTAVMRSILDSLASRFDESRELLRYMTGLLVFLGLLGTFWGLTSTVGAVSQVVGNLDISGIADPTDSLSKMTSGIGAAVGGMGTAFSSSLFGLVGSLILGFTALQTGQAQTRFYHELEEWLSGLTSGETSSDNSIVRPSYTALPLREIAMSLDRLSDKIDRTGGSSGSANAGEIRELTQMIQAMLNNAKSEQRVQREWMQKTLEQQDEVRQAILSLNPEKGRTKS